jgi:hypothetical protein
MPPRAAEPSPQPIATAEEDLVTPEVLGRLPADWPLALRPEAFPRRSSWPWQGPGPERAPAIEEAELAERAAAASVAVGDAVRVVAVPELFLRLPRRVRRRHGRIAGELFEILAFTLPGELAIGRVVRIRRGRQALQVFFLPIHCVERAVLAPLAADPLAFSGPATP